MSPGKFFNIWINNGGGVIQPALLPYLTATKKKKTSRPKKVAVKETPEPESVAPPAAPEPEPEKEPPKKQKRKSFWVSKRVTAEVGVFIFICAGLSLFLFGLHGSLAPVYLADIAVDPTSSQIAIEKQINQETSTYKLAFQFTDGKVAKFPASQAGISIDAKESAGEVRNQMSGDILSRLVWWRPIHIGLVTRTDQNVLQKFINESVIQLDQPYKNASLSVAGSQVNITPELNGNGQTLSNPYIDIPAAVASLNSKPLQLRKSTVFAPITQGYLHDEKDNLEKIINQKIVLHVDSKTVTVRPADIAAWLDLNPVEHAHTVDINVNSGKVLAYLNGLASPYIEPARSRLVTTRADGTVQVLDTGASGVDITNKDEAATSIAQQVMKAKGLDYKLDTAYAGAKTIQVTPADKWLVVDVTAKRVYAYEQTTLVRTFLSSSGAPKTPTALGRFAIYAKYAQQDMRGDNADGSRYFQPDVPWVNYFYRDYAVHGNYWRPLNYFGNINSSHGCVGVVNADAKWIYDWAPIGTPVIVHD